MNILVYVETRGGKIRGAGLEALTAARKLADAAGGSVAALLIGQGGAELTAEVGQYGTGKAFIAENAAFAGYSPEGYLETLLEAVRQSGAQVVVMTASSLGKDLAPMAAAKLDAAFLPDCTGLEWQDGRIVITRPVYAGKLNITLAAKELPVVISLRPKAFPPVPTGGTAETVKLSVNLEGKVKTRLVGVGQDAGGRLDVTEADVVVSGGRGMKAPENFKLIEELAETLRGAVGASRAVVDVGWRPHSEQVGQTGKVVSPTLYIACGISGAIQHLAGMRSSKVIVAINKDPEAPIFKSADYGIVGDALEVLPALTQAVKAIG
jgi:electron transfer flavoprotein alpha subunit